MRLPLILAGVAGLAVVVWLVAEHGGGDIVGAALALGWGLVPVLAWRAVPILCDARGWHVLFAADARPAFSTTSWIRWISESVNGLLPVAQIGGEVVRAHLISRRALVPAPEVTGGEAAGTVIVDLTTGLVATALFSLMGLILLLLGPGDSQVGQGIGWALGGLAAMTAAVVALQRGRLLTGFIGGVAEKLARGRSAGFAVEMKALESTFARLWAEPGTLLVSTLWRFASFVTAGFEVWLALWLLGSPVSLADALMLEALSAAARSAAFAVPGGLGVQEGSLLLLGEAVGVGAPTMLALALVKRLREVATGLPALILWWWVALRPVRPVQATR